MKKTIGLAFVLLSFISCKISEDAPDAIVHTTQIPLKVINPKPKFAVGDTLWMEASIPGKTLTDLTTSKVLDVQNAVFHLTLCPIQFLFVDSSDLLLQNRISYVTSNKLEKPLEDYPAMAKIEMGCPDTDFNLQVGIVFKDKGHYLFWLNRPFTNDVDDIRNYETVALPETGGCGNFGATDPLVFTYSSFVFDDTVGNQSEYEAFLQSIITDPLNWSASDTEAALKDGKKMYEKNWAYFAEVE